MALAQATKSHADKLAQLEAAVKAYVADKLPTAHAAWEQSLADLSAEALTEKKIPAEVAAALAKPAAERTAAENRQITRHYRTLDAELVKLDKAVKDHKAKAPQLPAEAKAQSVAELTKPRDTHIHLRGDFLSPGDAVAAATPAFLPPMSDCGPQTNRLDLADKQVCRRVIGGHADSHQRLTLSDVAACPKDRSRLGRWRQRGPLHDPE